MGCNVQKPMSITEQNVHVQENGQETGEKQVSRKWEPTQAFSVEFFDDPKAVVSIQEE